MAQLWDMRGMCLVISAVEELSEGTVPFLNYQWEEGEILVFLKTI